MYYLPINEKRVQNHIIGNLTTRSMQWNYIEIHVWYPALISPHFWWVLFFHESKVPLFIIVYLKRDNQPKLQKKFHRQSSPPINRTLTSVIIQTRFKAKFTQENRAVWILFILSSTHFSLTYNYPLNLFKYIEVPCVW